MSEIGAYEAKTHLSHLLERVERGERITLTRHGRPVAMFVPVEEKPAVAQVMDELRKFRKGRTLRGVSLREMIDDGRRL